MVELNELKSRIALIEFENGKLVELLRAQKIKLEEEQQAVWTLGTQGHLKTLREWTMYEYVFFVNFFIEN